MTPTKAIVNKPCSKNWDKMTKEGNGKFCGSCKKTVVDFTSWKDEDIKTYLLNQNESTCGHFNKSQVDLIRPRHHQYLVDLYSRIEGNFKVSFLKSIALKLVVISMFVVGCNNSQTNPDVTGTLAPPEMEEKQKDTSKITGNVAMPNSPTSPISLDTNKNNRSSKRAE